MTQIASSETDGKRRTIVTVVNSGNAHGRLEGGLDATGSRGRAIELVPEGTPILPGQTRTLALAPKAESGQSAPQPVYPRQDLRFAGQCTSSFGFAAGDWAFDIAWPERWVVLNLSAGSLRAREEIGMQVMTATGVAESRSGRSQRRPLGRIARIGARHATHIDAARHVPCAWR